MNRRVLVLVLAFTVLIGLAFSSLLYVRVRDYERYCMESIGGVIYRAHRVYALAVETTDPVEFSSYLKVGEEYQGWIYYHLSWLLQPLGTPSVYARITPVDVVTRDEARAMRDRLWDMLRLVRGPEPQFEPFTRKQINKNFREYFRDIDG